MSTRPKILYFITKANWGGAQRYVYDLAQEMPYRGFETSILSQSGALIDRAHSAGIRTHTLTSLDRDIDLLRDIKTFFNLIKILQAERPDILHLNSSKAGGLGSLAGRLVGVPVIIFTAHGWAMSEEYRPLWQRTLIYVTSWLTLLLCHHVITVSEADRKNGLSLPFSAGKIITIYNGIGPITKEEEPTRLRLELIPGASHVPGTWIGSIAELHFNKGIDVALRALTLLKQRGHAFIYIVIGEGEERAALEDLLRTYDLRAYVHFVGHRTQAARYALAFDIFLLPSRKEGFPYALLEAGASGQAVAAAAVGGIPEIIIDEVTGRLFPAQDSDSLALILESLIQNPHKRKLYGEALRHSTLTQFSKEKMVEETAALYRARLSLYT